MTTVPSGDFSSSPITASAWPRRWMKSAGSKRLHNQCGDALRALSDSLPKEVTGDRARIAMTEAQSQLLACQGILQQQLADLDHSDRRTANLAQRLYDSALACRMRPFSDGVHAFPRMVRDLGHSLGKQVRLEIVGGATEVDRDILEKLDAPLGHLLRNAIDHGIETPQERLLVGKPADGVIKIEARHGGGALSRLPAGAMRGGNSTSWQHCRRRQSPWKPCGGWMNSSP